MSHTDNTKNSVLRKIVFLGLITTIALSVILTGCGKKGVLEPIDRPTVYITSYEGQEDAADLADPYFFQRRIYWRGESTRGVITGFAYRALEEDGTTPIQTPYTYIDEEGWIYHYKPGADQSIPIYGDERSPDIRTIWTTKVWDTIHFPATVDGDSTVVTSIFEIKSKDHYYDTYENNPEKQKNHVSEIARRYFNVRSHVPDVDVIFSDRFRPIAAGADPDNPTFRTVGLGFEVEFEITEFTPYTTPANRPNYFMYRLERRNIASGDLISRKPEAAGEWFDTRGQNNVRRIWLVQDDDSPDDFRGRDDVKFILTPDEFEANDHTKPITETILYLRAVNMANVQSPERQAKFRVYENFRPKAIVYSEGTNVLGRNHFTTYQDASLSRPLPERHTPEGTHYGTPFFTSKTGLLSTVWSDDLRIYLRWGWRGQFEDNDPEKGFINELHDNQTGRDYLSAVKFFDLRLGDGPYPYQPLLNHPEYETKYRHIDSEGREWMRVPRFHEIDTRALLMGIEPGEYDFAIRVIDTQNRASNVELFSFYIAEKVPRDQKKGILIIDNETFPSPVFKNHTIDFYQGILDSLNITPNDVINRQQMRNDYEYLGLHFGRSFLSTADLEPYRLVIWHSDNPTEIGPNNANLHHEFEVVNIYLRGGGNMLISAGANLNSMKNAAEAQSFINATFHRYFGLTFRHPDVTKTLSNTYFGPAARPYLTGAKSATGAPITNLSDINIDWNHPYLAALKLSTGIEGLGPVTYFNENYFADTNTKSLFGMKVTDAGADFEGTTVAIRRKTDTNTTYLFGFPLSYMKQSDAAKMVQRVYQDVGPN